MGLMRGKPPAGPERQRRPNSRSISQPSMPPAACCPPGAVLLPLMAAGGMGALLALLGRIAASEGSTDCPGSAATDTPWCPARITLLQMSTGSPPPVALRVGDESSLPIQTPVTRFAV